jgi:hypothetical protein
MGILRACVFGGQDRASILLTSASLKANILIDQTGRARLADFGLVTIISDRSSLLPSSSHTQGGTARWMSPELIDPERFGFRSSRRTKSSDCYAFGMVIYETISGRFPFHQHADLTVVMKVLEGERPTRGPGFAESLWGILKQCWAPQPSDRPTVEDVFRRLERVRTETGGGGGDLDSAGNSPCTFSHFIPRKRSMGSTRSITADIQMSINGPSDPSLYNLRTLAVHSKPQPLANTYSPVRSRHHSGSLQRSLSSTAGRIPQESGGGHDALGGNTDASGRDPKRATIKPSPYKTMQRMIPPPLQPQFSPNVVEGGLTEAPPLQRKTRHLLSSGNSRLPPIEYNRTLPTRRAPQTISSDAVLQSERMLENSEIKTTQRRAHQHKAEERDKQREKRRTHERERERERETQRRPQPKGRGTGASEHCTIVPSDEPPSDYKKERPTKHDSHHSPPSRLGQGFGGYSSRGVRDGGGNSGETGSTSAQTNWAASLTTPGGNTKQQVSLTPRSLAHRSHRGTEDSNVAIAEYPTPLQSDRRKPLPLLPTT